MTDEVDVAAEDQAWSDEFDAAIQARATGEPVEHQEELPEEPDRAPDLYEGMTDAQKKYFQQVEHRNRSDSGRIAAFQRQLETVQAQLDAALVAGGEEEQSSGPSQAELDAALASDEGWQNFQTEYPEIAEAMDSRLNAALDRRFKDYDEQIGRRIAPAEQIVARNAFNDANQALTNDYGNWQQRVASPEFDEWIATQNDDVKAWVQSDDVGDAAQLIQTFDNYLKANGLMDQFNESPDTGDLDTGRSSAEAFQQRRQRQLESGDSVRSQGARVNTDGPGGDFESQFALEVQRRKQLAGA